MQRRGPCARWPLSRRFFLLLQLTDKVDALLKDRLHLLRLNAEFSERSINFIVKTENKRTMLFYLQTKRAPKILFTDDWRKDIMVQDTYCTAWDFITGQHTSELYVDFRESSCVKTRDRPIFTNWGTGFALSFHCVRCLLHTSHSNPWKT